MLNIVIVCLICFCQIDAINLTDYYKIRENWITREAEQALGNKIVLTEQETTVNDILMQWKYKETDCPHHLPFSDSYFALRNDMKQSKVYQFIRRMPKGAALHVHSSLMLDPNDLMKLTYENNLYACFIEPNLKFIFSDNTPKHYCPVPWTLMSKLRSSHKNITNFDAMLKQRLTLGPEDNLPSTKTDEVWKTFENTISTINSLINCRPIREKVVYQSLQNLYDDKVMYAEIRISLSPLYELNGTVHHALYTAFLYKQVVKIFKETHPDFSGLKLIITANRNSNEEQVWEELNLAHRVKKIFPGIFAGFDLVGQEDHGKPLTKFLPLLIEAKNDMDFFLHAGETSLHGTSVDENLFDAILLGTKRIGHGNALIKHPALLQAISQNDIAIEVNVISNSVLSLVQDLRNHPLATYLALGLPVVLSSDDPGMWGARPLTDDFYVAFVAIASRHADLKLLKQLAYNSIRYSALDMAGKTKLFATFEKGWNAFIYDVISQRQ